MHHDIAIYSFPRGHNNEFCNLIVSLCSLDFPISAYGYSYPAHDVCIEKVNICKSDLREREREEVHK